MRIAILFAPLVALGLSACSNKKQASDVQVATVSSVGAEVPSTAATPLADVLSQPDRYAGQTLVVEGLVRAACKKKGCWMEITPDQKDTRACRVRFKDYGFFVPTDSAGAEARLSGEVKVRVLAPEEVQHLEGEGATVQKGTDGSARAVEITATGVELSRR